MRRQLLYLRRGSLPKAAPIPQFAPSSGLAPTLLLLVTVLASLSCGSRTAFVTSDLPTLSLEEDSRVEGFVPDLGSIHWVGEGPAGVFAVFQERDHRIRLLDAAGEDLAVLGGPGTAPVGSPNRGGAGWIEDTLWVSDMTRGRIVLYGEDRRPFRTLPALSGAYPRAGEEALYPRLLFLWPLMVYPGDTLLVLADQAMEGPASGWFSDGIQILRISPEGEIQNHVARLPGTLSTGGGRPGLGGQQATDPLEGSRLFHLSPGGDRIALVSMEEGGGRGARWTLRVLDPYGNLILERGYRSEDAPAPEEVVVGADHRLWVGIREVSDRLTWVVLNPRGDPEARVSFQVFGRILAADENHLWVSETDVAGALTVVRYRISGGE